MFDFFENMRQKPLSRRRLVAFGLALSITGLLFVVWLSVWLPDFFYTQNVESKNNSSFESPKDNVLDSIGSAWQTMQGEFVDLKSAIGGVDLTSQLQYTATTTATTTSPKVFEPLTPLSASATPDTSSSGRGVSATTTPLVDPLIPPHVPVSSH